MVSPVVVLLRSSTDVFPCLLSSVWLFKSSESLSLDPLILLATTLSLLSSRMAWVSLLLATSLLSVLYKLLFSELLLRLLLCHLPNTLEDHRIFQVVSMVLLEPSQEDTHSKPKL